MAFDPNSCFVINDDLLNFSLDDDSRPPSSSMEFSYPNNQDLDSDDYSRSIPEFAEEELEWLSNKDAFPSVDTCFDVKIVEHRKPVSIVENHSSGHSITSYCGSLHVPVRKRSSRRRRGRECCWWNQVMQPPSSLPKPPATGGGSGGLGRRCQHCFAEKTPQWRAGPMGPKTLCNACGVRYKSGRLVTEYRPASSPTFSSGLHSNSHRKIMEMRKKMQAG
ncbi:hypothetical protein L2E82_04676 [Cichorium intybus]|uniref:Uncharacterized protein n=1 Tax=Cichorium intybus TaxID=13427 RepID=A0ACB9H704_CICIN|nr:hypothetical protein L2E82_04676 [Cichorium intybus]